MGNWSIICKANFFNLFPQAVCNIAPRGVYVCGNATTTSGLTVTLSRESSSGDFALEAGALVLADQGIVLKCIYLDQKTYRWAHLLRHKLSFHWKLEMQSQLTGIYFSNTGRQRMGGVWRERSKMCMLVVMIAYKARNTYIGRSFWAQFPSPSRWRYHLRCFWVENSWWRHSCPEDACGGSCPWNGVTAAHPAVQQHSSWMGAC